MIGESIEKMKGREFKSSLLRQPVLDFRVLCSKSGGKRIAVRSERSFNSAEMEAETVVPSRRAGK
jgi:hypothetical protein